jgi:alpha-L-fucosidase
LIQENFRDGQRIQEFKLEALTQAGWRNLFTGTTVGYKRIVRFDPVTSSKVKLKITSSRDTPQIATVGLYRIELEIGN